jgi:hypothetical protein
MDLPTLNSSPPALSCLPSGRLVCSWGFRLPDDGSGPTAIQARTSDDHGQTWNDTITLRHDGFDYDIGYNRQAVRPDGKVVTVYYYRTKGNGQSPTYIAATIWDVEEIKELKANKSGTARHKRKGQLQDKERGRYEDALE